jgi:hypothetical protein
VDSVADSRPALRGEALSAVLQPYWILAKGSPPHERHLTLVSAVSHGANQAGRIEIVRAYWKLSEAHARLLCNRRIAAEVAGLRAARDGAALHPIESSMLESLALSTAAREREATALIAVAEHDLAVQMGTLDRPPGVPADAPHWGSYTTRYKQFFGVRGGPPQASRLERIIPIKRDALAARGMAVQARTDALRDARDAWQAGQIGLDALASRLEELELEERALLAATVDYNMAILDYCALVPSGPLAPRDFVSMLIKVKREASAVSDRAGQPSTPRASSDGWRPASGAPASSSNLDDVAGLANPESYQDAAAPDRPPRGSATEPQAGLERDSATSAVPVTDVDWLWRTPAQIDGRAVRPLVLADALRRSSDPKSTALAYWKLLHAAGRYQFQARRESELEALTRTTLDLRSQAGGAEAMVRLHAARLAAQADRIESRQKLLTAQWELAELAGVSTAEASLLWPATAPRTGGPLPQGQPVPGAAALWSRRVRTSGEALASRAASSTAALEVQNSLSQAFQQGDVDLDTAIQWIERASHEHDRLVSDLTAYNLAVSEYVAAVTPGRSREQLLQALLPLDARLGRLPSRQ